MIEASKHLGVEESVAVGTEAFRKAENGAEALRKI
jgi:exopolyphosphatase/pppGpp-phosphohydrolase